MKYEIKDEDENIYGWDNIEDVMEALASTLTGHQYRINNGEWFPGYM